MKTFELKGTSGIFFSEFFVHTLLQERGFPLENRDFLTIEVIKQVILGLLGHEIQRYK